jgi:urease accessory protein
MNMLAAASEQPAADPSEAGWRAQLELGFELRGTRTVLARRRREGPLAVQRTFHPEGAPCHLYLLHPPGGVVGGDRLEVTVEVADGGHALITAPGATKSYRSAGARAHQTQRLQVAAGGTLEWLPHEAILFPGANLRAQTLVDLDPGARFLGWEILCLGRPVVGERFTDGSADCGIRVSRGGRPLLNDRLRVLDTGGLDGSSGLRGLPVSATLIASGAGADDLAAAREVVAGAGPVVAGVTRVEDLLIARCLADGVEPVQRIFRALWGILRPRLLGVTACAPRIWAT